MKTKLFYFAILLLFQGFVTAGTAKALHIKSTPNSNVILVAVMKDTDTPYKNMIIASLKAHYQPKYEVRK